MRDSTRREFVLFISGTAATFSGCVGARNEQQVSRDEFEKLKRRVEELEGEVETTASDRLTTENRTFTEDRILISEGSEAQGIRIFGMGKLDVVSVSGPRGSATTDEPKQKPVRIGGENPDMKYVPGGFYEIFGETDERREYIMTYTAPQKLETSQNVTDRNSENPSEKTNQDTPGDVDNKEQEEERDTSQNKKYPGVAVSFVEDATRRNMEIYIRPPEGKDSVDTDSLFVRRNGEAVAHIQSPSSGDVVEVGGAISDIEYRPNRTYTVVSKMGGTNVTVDEYTTEKVR